MSSVRGPESIQRFCPVSDRKSRCQYGLASWSRSCPCTESRPRSVTSISLDRRHALRNVLSTGLVLVTLALATPAAAQETKLQVHGYLTQAYGAAHGGTFLGIPEAGTADYRTAALQLRYTMSASDQFVWQFSHRRLGQSPITV